VTGWGRQEIQFVVDHDDLVQESQQTDGYHLECRGDCDLSVPATSILEVERVNGDVRIQHITGSVTLEGAGGDLEIKRIGSCTLGSISGDASISQVQGGVKFRQVSGDVDVEAITGDVVGEIVGGDCSISDVRGSVVINRVNGDFDLEHAKTVTAHQVNGDFDFEGIDGDITVRSVSGDVSGDRLTGGFIAETVRGDLSLLNLQGSFQAHVAGDAHVGLTAALRLDSSLHSGDDITLAHAGDGNATVDIGSGEGRILLDRPGHTELIRSTTHQVVLGNGTARVTLRAGGQVRLTSQAWEPADDLDSSLESLTEDISRQVNQGLGDLERHIPEVRIREERIKAATRKIEDRLAEARHKLEQRSRQIAERFGGRVPWTHPSEAKPVQTPESREEPAQKVEPVTEDERLIILRMVQEKKISIDEAEQLLAALDEFDEQSHM